MKLQLNDSWLNWPVMSVNALDRCPLSDHNVTHLTLPLHLNILP